MAELQTNFTKIKNGKSFLMFNMLYCLLPSLSNINLSLEYMKCPQARVIYFNTHHVHKFLLSQEVNFC